MKIKSLSLTGFKSFYENTKIQFDGQLNAVVGPNGCGKSNVLDAIRWILGEQNPRQLRADIMEELISNGSETLKPLGMAEASLVLKDVPSYDFEEVEIKRRIFRSGEGEYYLNGVSCRLKDVTDVFIDTGSGARSYSVIGQGRIDQLITAKPEDKRVFVEEVAGIRKYKIRRRETETRIRSAKENLSRVQDMTNEVKRQMDNLDAQAKQAQKFRELSKRTSELELKILRIKLRNLENSKKIILEDKLVVDESASEAEKEIILVSKCLKGLEGKAASLEKEVVELERQNYLANASIQSKESSRELIKSEISSIDRFIEKIVSETALLNQEQENIGATTEAKKAARSRVNMLLESERERIQDKESKLLIHRAGSSEIHRKRQEVRGGLFKILNDYSAFKGVALGHQRELEELRSRKKLLLKEIEEAQSEKNKLSDEAAKLEGLLRKNEAIKKRVNEDKNQLELTLDSLNELLGTKLNQKNRFNERLKGDTSRLNALNQIQSNYEWLPKEIGNFIIDNKGKGVLGTVADFISVSKGYEKAAQASLGEKASWIVVRDNSDAIAAIESFRERSSGRATFIATKGANYKTPNNKRNDNLRTLSEVVKLDKEKLGFIDGILEKTLLVPSIEKALELRLRMDGGLSFVTPGGDGAYSDGAVAGGAAQPGAIERKAEIETLINEVAKLEDQTRVMSTEIKSDENRIRNVKLRIKESDRELIQLGIKEAEAKKDIINVKSNLKKVEERIKAIGKSSERTDSEINDKSKTFEEMNAKIRLLDVEKTDFEQQFKEIEEKIKSAEGKEKALESEIADIKVTCASLIEKRKNIQEDLTDIDKRKGEIAKRLGSEARNIEAREQEKLNLIEKDKSTVREIKNYRIALSQSENILSLKRNERAQTLRDIRATNESKEMISSRLSDLRLKNNSLELDLNGVQIEIENIKERMSANSDFAIKQGNDCAVTDSTPQDCLNIDVEAEEAKLREFQSRIERFGPVNLLAPEEYNRLEERYDFLTAQMQDITKALVSLGKAITKIDKESKKRFGETYEAIEKKFREVFSRIFRGGEGKLILTDPDDVLESGVDVVVRPRGKKFQPITLLSGGEKALSAIALVISACLIKPPPFLLLDEIDAPLDDRNTSCFIELIKEIDKNSQIILVTHNKRTMQDVNSLIGITSNKGGDSTVVSVDLN